MANIQQPSDNIGAAKPNGVALADLKTLLSAGFMAGYQAGLAARSGA